MFRSYKLLSLMMIISALFAGCQTRNIPSTETFPASHISNEPVLIPTVPVTQILPEPTLIPMVTVAQPPVSDLSSGLDGLDFDTFVEQSSRRLLSRDPETALELGLSQLYDLPTDQLTDISDEYIRQTQGLESGILTILRRYGRSSLTPAQQLTYDIYLWYLADRVDGHAFMYDDYPINPTVFSVHLDLLQWFTDLRPVTNLQEAQDYINCLSQVDRKFAQLIDGLQRREANGVLLPGFLINYIQGGLKEIATSPAEQTPYFSAFQRKIDLLSDLSTIDKESLLSSAQQAITNSVLPAYQALVRYFEHLQTVATNDPGVWKFPNGEEYYAYLLKHYTSTDMSAEQIHALGLQALDRIHDDMRKIFDQLGYPKNESIPQLYDRVSADSGIYSADEIIQGYEDIITEIDQQVNRVFDLRPSIGVIVVGDPIGGYYIPPAVDGSRPGMFYAQNTGYVARYSMPTLAYHEAIPGHHTQLAIAQQLDLPAFRRWVDFPAYTEGWALYAEHLAFEMGMYDHDPYGDLGRLQAEAFRSSRLVVDTGLHAKHWTFDQALNFMVENTGMPENMLEAEVSRYISIPGQATAYYIGYTRIMELRQQAMEELDDKFDYKDYHNIMLGNGAMPLDILERVIDDYIQSTLGGR